MAESLFNQGLGVVSSLPPLRKRIRDGFCIEAPTGRHTTNYIMNEHETIENVTRIIDWLQDYGCWSVNVYVDGKFSHQLELNEFLEGRR